MRKHIESRDDIRPFVVDFIPTAAYVRIRRDGTIDPDPRLNLRWNVDKVAEALLKSMPFPVQVKFARMAEITSFQQAAARGAIAAGVGVNALLGIAPASKFREGLVGLSQASMSGAVAYLMGCDLRREYAPELLTAMGSSLGTSLTLWRANRLLARREAPPNAAAVEDVAEDSILRRRSSHVPGGVHSSSRWVSSGLAAASTMVLGLAVEAYFARRFQQEKES
jgi:hypothetical protein